MVIVIINDLTIIFLYHVSKLILFYETFQCEIFILNLSE